MKNHEWAPGQSRWAECTHPTIGHYEENAESFKEGTWDHDVSQNLDALLSALELHDSPRILDFGCGPGRDLLELQRRGPARQAWMAPLDSVSWRPKLRGVRFCTRTSPNWNWNPPVLRGFLPMPPCFIFHRAPSMQFFGTCGRLLSPMESSLPRCPGEAIRKAGMERVTAHTTHRNGGMGFWLKQVSQWSTRITDRPENPGTSNHGTPPSRGRSCQTPEQKRFTRCFLLVPGVPRGPARR